MIELNDKKLTAKATVNYTGVALSSGAWRLCDTLAEARQKCDKGSIRSFTEAFWLEDEEGRKQGPAQHFCVAEVEKDQVQPNQEIVTELQNDRVLVSYLDEEKIYVDDICHIYKSFDPRGNCLEAGKKNAQGNRIGRWATRGNAGQDWAYTDYNENGEIVRRSSEIRQNNDERRAAFKHEQKLRARLGIAATPAKKDKEETL